MFGISKYLRTPLIKKENPLRISSDKEHIKKVITQQRDYLERLMIDGCNEEANGVLERIDRLSKMLDK